MAWECSFLEGITYTWRRYIHRVKACRSQFSAMHNRCAKHCHQPKIHAFVLKPRECAIIPSNCQRYIQHLFAWIPATEISGFLACIKSPSLVVRLSLGEANSGQPFTTHLGILHQRHLHSSLNLTPWRMLPSSILTISS